MTQTLTKENTLDNLRILEKRAHYLLGSHLRERDRMTEALRIQDALRATHTSSTTWDSVEIIRHWRESR